MTVIQSTMSQPWVFALGVWVLAVVVAIDRLIAAGRVCVDLARGFRVATSLAATHRLQRTHTLRTVKVGGKLVKRWVPRTAEPGSD